MKKIISFSLYGNKPNFQVGAVVNVLEAIDTTIEREEENEKYWDYALDKCARLR